jgi:hypothetical protein
VIGPLGQGRSPRPGRPRARTIWLGCRVTTVSVGISAILPPAFAVKLMAPDLGLVPLTQARYGALR